MGWDWIFEWRKSAGEYLSHGMDQRNGVQDWRSGGSRPGPYRLQSSCRLEGSTKIKEPQVDDRRLGGGRAGAATSKLGIQEMFVEKVQGVIGLGRIYVIGNIAWRQSRFLVVQRAVIFM